MPLHSRRNRRLSLVAAYVEVLEDRSLLSPGIVAVGSDVGSIGRVDVYNSETGQALYQFLPYADFPSYRGGVRTAVADINTDGVFDIITAPGPGMSPLVRVFNGGAPTQLLRQFYAYDPLFTGGVFVASADVNRDGYPEIITGPDQGGGPHLRVFDSRFGSVMWEQFVYGPLFTGGVRVATGDVNGDSYPDVITGAGPGGGPHVRVFNGFNGVQLPGPIGSFFAYGPRFTGGVYVASANFGGSSPAAEVVTGAGAGGGPHVRIIDPLGPIPTDPRFDLNFTTTQFPFDPAFRGGVRVAAAYADNIDAIADLFVGTGPGTTPDLRVFFGASGVELYRLAPTTGPLPGGSTTLPAPSPGGIFPSSGKIRSEPLLTQEVQSPGDVNSITDDDLQPVILAVVARLEAVLPEASRIDLTDFRISLADLPGGVLGLTQPHVILLDRDAAGHGWFVDATPLQDEEFNAVGLAIDAEAQGRIDLFTVLAHEFGHHLGFEDLDPTTHSDALMADHLNPSERRQLTSLR